MSDAKQCPKCKTTMDLGTVQATGNYSSSPFVWAPKDDVQFPVKGTPSKRVAIVTYRCEKCGFVEFYAPANS